LPLRAQDSLEIVVASTTDVHGRLRGWDYFGDAPDPLRGLARAATIVDSVRMAHPGRVVLVDAGDLLQGNPMTYTAARVDTGGAHPVIAAMNAMRYDAAAVGNHEFNYGLPTLRNALRGASFPFLAANARFLGRERPLFSPSRIVEREGVRIGIVGATTPGAMVWDRENLRGRLRITDIVPAVRAEVAAVRRRGADLVVVVMHSGLAEPSSYDTVTTRLPSENVAARVAREVRGVDLVVFGHSHREVADTTINGVMLVQPRNWATSVSVATVTMRRTGGTRWTPVRKRGVIVRSAGHAEHPEVVAVVEGKHRAAVAWVNQTLGTTPVAWRADSARVVDTPIIDFILEVQRQATGADLAATAAFDLGASLDTGTISVAEVARLYPYDNTLRAIRVTGKQLREFLEYSARYYHTLGSPQAAASLVDRSVPGYNFDIVAGADYTIDLSRPLGQRVTKLEVRGRAVRDTDRFTMALNNYRQGGGGGFAMLHGAPVVHDLQEEIRDLLIAEVRRRGTLRPEDFHRRNWQLAPDSAVAMAYRAMRAAPFDSVARAEGPSPHLRDGRWLRIIGTTDFHGALEPRVTSGDGVPRGGVAYLLSAIAAARRECAPPRCSTIWLDGGDQLQGTPASNLNFGRPVIDFFNQHGLAAAALGNHEFDWGLDTLRSIMRAARYPMLAANLLDTLGRDVPWVPDDTLLTAGGIRVGVIGVITPETARAARPSIVRGFQFVDAASIVDARARALRNRGAEVIVVVAHEGAVCNRQDPPVCEGEILSLARRLTERVDAIIAGHRHTGVVARAGSSVIAQAYSRGTAIAVVDVPLDASGRTTRVELRNVRPDSITPIPEVAADVARITAAVEEQFAVPVAEVATLMRRGGSGTLGNLIADAQRIVGQGDLAVMNRGGVRADLPAGMATVGRIFEIAPFENALMRITLRGDALRAYLEGIVGQRGTDFHLSGARLEVDTTRAAGSRIVRAAMADGSAIDDRRTYRLILLDFLAEGGDGLGVTQRALSTEALGILDRDAIMQYLRSVPKPVQPPRDARVVQVRP
jgi:2',3'-cyclic-nucleotide 2'-phosphodiesterase (5'-nucleotidase family)